MGQGKLTIRATTGSGGAPIENAQVTVSQAGTTLYQMVTNQNGLTDPMGIQAPDAAGTLTPSGIGPWYATVDVEVTAAGYVSKRIEGVQIFDGQGSTLPVDMTPSLQRRAAAPVVIPANNLHSSEARVQEGSAQSRRSRRLGQVMIPETIVVHLGRPADSARNIRVPFVDYIKNVASSEIYPTWPQGSLEANIYCQISFALNRVYTEWYRSRGYDFQITSSTGYDMAFVEGRNLFDSVSAIVDEIFNAYIRRVGHTEPFFAQFCNGTTATCPGLSQWGTVDLANQGLSSLNILKYYYPQDIEIVSTNLIGGAESFPGTLRQGSRGEAVRQLQTWLGRIRTNYPLIPAISPDGDFGPATAEAVRTYQQAFSLTPDEIAGPATWHSILRTYVAVTGLAELESEGIRQDIGDVPPASVLRRGDKGRDVVQLQFILNSLARYYPEILEVIENSSYDDLTRQAVEAFQRLAGLNPDGIVGPATWNALYAYYRVVSGGQPAPEPPSEPPAYPGALLYPGSRGDSVLLIQQALARLAGRYPAIPAITPDGIFGPATERAVMAFQRLFGLSADGIVGPLTWECIMLADREELDPDGPQPYPGVPLQEGSRGDGVLAMQQTLNAIAEYCPFLPPIAADGIFGSATKNAVLVFQRAAGLVADGVVGPVTWNAIIEAFLAL